MLITDIDKVYIYDSLKYMATCKGVYLRIEDCKLVGKEVGLSLAFYKDYSWTECIWGCTITYKAVDNVYDTLKHIQMRLNEHMCHPKPFDIDGVCGGREEYVKYCKSDIEATRSLCHGIKNVIFNNPATIVFWNDGTKTVVKAQEGEEYIYEVGLAMAIAKKYFGNKGSYYNNISKWVEKQRKQDEKDAELIAAANMFDAYLKSVKDSADTFNVYLEALRDLNAGFEKRKNRPVTGDQV